MTRIQLGSYLREARESRGLQLEDVVKTTRISKNYLIAMENGDFDKLPNVAYVKGFLRLYAGFVGISGDEVVSMYEKTSDVAADAAESDESSPTHYDVKPAGRGRWLLPLLLLILVLVVAFFLQGKEEKKITPPPVVKPQQIIQVVPPVLPVRSSARPDAEKTSVTPAPPVSEPVPVAAEPRLKGVFLKLKCTQDGSLNITIDDSLSQYYDLKSGDVIEWKAENSFALDLGNAGGVEAEFNGKNLKPFGAVGASAHVVLKADYKQ